MEAAKLSNAHGFISALPQGYNTKVSAERLMQPELSFLQRTLKVPTADSTPEDKDGAPATQTSTRPSKVSWPSRSFRHEYPPHTTVPHAGDG